MARRPRRNRVSSTRTVVVQAPRSLVYDVLTDRERYGEIMAISSTLETPGRDARQGVGAIHFLGRGRFGVREQITELVPDSWGRGRYDQKCHVAGSRRHRWTSDRRMSYEVRSGLPTAAHRGWTVLTDTPEGTHLTYTMQNDPGRVPRHLVALFLLLSVRMMTRAVQKEAERRASAAARPTTDDVQREQE